MKNIRHFRKAFSLVELIFVITVLGIVASMSADTIVQVFKNTIPQKATNAAAVKSEIAVEQIANRLSYAVPWSVVYKNPNNTGIVQIGDADENDQADRVIEWIGTDGDGFEATGTPGWSGYCDVQNSTRTLCPTPGSSLDNIGAVVTNLGGAGLSDAIVLFKTDNCAPGGVRYSPDTMGMNGEAYNNTCAFAMTGSAGTSLAMPNTPKVTADMYSVAWSAYALVPVNERDINQDGTNDVFDLELRYGYQPWRGENFNTAGIGRQVIATNVSVFKAAQNPVSKNDIRIKICIKQPIGGGATDFISVCKEKAVIR